MFLAHNIRKPLFYHSEYEKTAINIIPLRGSIFTHQKNRPKCIFSDLSEISGEPYALEMFQVNAGRTSDNTNRAAAAARKNRVKTRDAEKRSRPELRIIRIIGSSRNTKTPMNTCVLDILARRRRRLPLETFQVKRRFAGLDEAAEKCRSDVERKRVLRRIGRQKLGVFYRISHERFSIGF